MSVTLVITVAAGAFAAGHLGELTRIVPSGCTSNGETGYPALSPPPSNAS
jgi:hypothetical protein